MVFKLCASVVIAASLASQATNAASVTNLDKISRTITVEEKGKRQEHILNPGAVLEGICLEGCLIHVGAAGSDPFEVEASDITTIEDGLLWGEDLDATAIPPASAPPNSTSPRR